MDKRRRVGEDSIQQESKASEQKKGRKKFSSLSISRIVFFLLLFASSFLVGVIKRLVFPYALMSIVGAVLRGGGGGPEEVDETIAQNFFLTHKKLTIS